MTQESLDRLKSVFLNKSSDTELVEDLTVSSEFLISQNPNEEEIKKLQELFSCEYGQNFSVGRIYDKNRKQKINTNQQTSFPRRNAGISKVGT